MWVPRRWENEPRPCGNPNEDPPLSCDSCLFGCDETMLNRIVIMGRLGRDPELRYTQAGGRWPPSPWRWTGTFKDKASGERATDWIPVVAWEARAKFVQQYFHKGQMAVVEGRLQIRDWTDKDGGKRHSAEVIADGIYFAGAKRPPSPARATQTRGRSHLRRPGSSRTWTMTEGCHSDDNDIVLELPPGAGDHGMPLVRVRRDGAPGAV